jgi:hypothetical protein
MHCIRQPSQTPVFAAPWSPERRLTARRYLGRGLQGGRELILGFLVAADSSLGLPHPLQLQGDDFKDFRLNLWRSWRAIIVSKLALYSFATPDAGLDFTLPQF